jgi:hypothetical protein
MLPSAPRLVLVTRLMLPHFGQLNVAAPRGRTRFFLLAIFPRFVS